MTELLCSGKSFLSELVNSENKLKLRSVIGFQISFIETGSPLERLSFFEVPFAAGALFANISRNIWIQSQPLAEIEIGNAEYGSGI